MKRFTSHLKFWTFFSSLSLIASVFLILEYSKLFNANLPSTGSKASTVITNKAETEYEQEEYEAPDLNFIKDIAEALKELFSNPF